MQIIVNGLLTNYQRLGQGKQIIILPGWADTTASWHNFALQLAEFYDVIVLDLPGFGKTEPPKEAWDLDDYARFVQAFIYKAGLSPYGLVGHSNGGAIAIRGLAEGLIHPEKLLLLASAGIRGEAKTRQGALTLITKTGKLLAKPLPRSVQARLRKKLYQGVGSDMLVSEQMQVTFKKIVADDVRQSAAKVAVPTLLLYGDRDNQTPVHYGEMLCRLIPRARLQTIAGAGHFLQLDQPQPVLQAVREFL